MPPKTGLSTSSNLLKYIGRDVVCFAVSVVVRSANSSTFGLLQANDKFTMKGLNETGVKTTGDELTVPQSYLHITSQFKIRTFV